MATLLNIYNLLNKHPYFNKLSEDNKLNVMNIALANYKENVNAEISYAVYPNNTKGFDQVLIDNDVPHKIGQPLLSLSSLSDYSAKDLNLTKDTFLKEFSEEEQNIILTIAISKVANNIPDQYTVQNIEGSVSYIHEAIGFRTEVSSISVIAIDNSEESYLTSPRVGYSLVKKTEEEVELRKPVVSYELVIDNTLASSSLLPRFDNNPYSFEGAFSKLIVDVAINKLVNVETVYMNSPVSSSQLSGKTFLQELTNVSAKVSYQQWASTEPIINLSKESEITISKPRIIYQKY